MAVHVAVLLSGSFRTLLDCNGTLVQQLHRANPNVHFHTFLALTINKESDRPLAEQAAVESYPCVAAVRVDADSEVTEAVRREMPDVDSLPKGRGTARGKALNIIKMFRGIWTASRLMRGKVPHNPMQLGCIPLPKSKSRYDMVLRVRPDLCFCKPLDLHGPISAIMNNKTSHDWYVQHACTHANG